ncbi:MAG: type II toxin-antitoxin system VapC family toxin [Deltaproteobacteria bacterium]|nr:type II toxin-antitoxin system VapC family toxin [Deltaproteobacteria bacterium]
MKVLLDTHTFICWDSDPAKLLARATAACLDPANTSLLSAASVWEMVIKAALGKLTLSLPLADAITSQQQRNRLGVLAVELQHVLAVQQLPARHRDPFDRLLIAQALVEDAVLLSKDPIFAGYPITVHW